MRNAICAIALLTVVGCGQGAPEPTAEQLAESSLTVRPIVGLAGYTHALERSRFALGTGASSKSELGMNKVVGSDGVFASLPLTGMTMGVPNANAPSLTVPRYGVSAADHDGAVRSYFVRAGIPEAQILSVTPQVAVSGTFSQAGSFAPPALPPVSYYFSTVHRHANGVEVVDSFAWARMNADGNVVQESVYWPELPATVTMEAEDFARTLSDPAGAATFAATLPKDVLHPAGRLVIHHTPGEWSGSFSAMAAFDVPHPGGKTRHFDRRGVELHLPHEADHAWGSPNETPRSR
jgi:hypothetical protein